MTETTTAFAQIVTDGNEMNQTTAVAALEWKELNCQEQRLLALTRCSSDPIEATKSAIKAVLEVLRPIQHTQ